MVNLKKIHGKDLFVELNNNVLYLIKMYTFEDMNYFNNDSIGNEIGCNWICIWLIQ